MFRLSSNPFGRAFCGSLVKSASKRFIHRQPISTPNLAEVAKTQLAKILEDQQKGDHDTAVRGVNQWKKLLVRVAYRNAGSQPKQVQSFQLRDLVKRALPDNQTAVGSLKEGFENGGRVSIAKGKYKEAIDHLFYAFQLHANEQDSHSIALRRMMSLCQLKAHQYALAQMNLADLTQKVTSSPNELNVLMNDRATCLLASAFYAGSGADFVGQLELAKEIFESVLRNDQSNPVFLANYEISRLAVADNHSVGEHLKGGAFTNALQFPVDMQPLSVLSVLQILNGGMLG